MKKFLAFTAFILAFALGGFAEVRLAEAAGARFIFLFIGDGMGPNQYRAAQERGLTGNLDLLPERSTISTHAHGNVITDSAAAATALATGVKTKNGVLGLNAKGQRVENVLELAKNAGMKTGVISSMSLNHATPAAFYAHTALRNDYYLIGTQLIASGIDYFGGGGFMHDKGKNKDKNSLFSLAKNAGLVLSVNPALRSDGCMPYVEKRPANGRALADFVSEAISLLYGENGFVLVVEGGNIDYACHDNEFERMLHEIADFDASLSPALAFYKEHPSDTLIIATADHETGGLQLNNGKVSWGTKYHTGVNVPIFANIKLNDVADNTDVAKLIKRCF